MFYIVEQEEKLINLERLSRLGMYVDVIPTNDNYHPKLNSCVAVYVRPINSKHGFIIPINHSEGLNISKERVYKLVSNTARLYTLDKKNLVSYCN